MLVRKKYMVQKSFRIDEKIDRDITIISKLTDRSQNELVNCAISEFLMDNGRYFIEIAVLEHFMFQINNGSELIEDFEMGSLTVKMEYVNDEKVRVSGFNIIDGERTNEFSTEFESDICEELEDYLKGLSLFIDDNSDDVKKYLESRMDYRDYVKVNKI